MELLKNLNLTENDFQLMVDGLDALPEKGIAGNMMVDILSHSLMKDPEEREKFERERNKEKAKRDQEKAILIENVRILQGKLLTMKRIMIENNLLEEANESLK